MYVLYKRAFGTLFHKINIDLITIRLQMDLSRRDAFRPSSRHSSGDKSQFCFISQKKLIRIGPCHLKSPLVKDETRRDGSDPFIVIKL